jgi:hypothetical protein
LYFKRVTWASEVLVFFGHLSRAGGGLVFPRVQKRVSDSTAPLPPSCAAPSCAGPVRMFVHTTKMCTRRRRENLGRWEVGRHSGTLSQPLEPALINKNPNHPTPSSVTISCRGSPTTLEYVRYVSVHTQYVAKMRTGPAHTLRGNTCQIPRFLKNQKIKIL